MWQVFDDDKADWDTERARLRDLLSEQEWQAARLTTINAHYTDPALIAPIWGLVSRLGFSGGSVLEPGCGAGTSIGLAPESALMTGVELDPLTAAIARRLYPAADIRAESFAETRFPAGHFDAAVGNVPFADVVLYDPRYNQARLSLHNHFIVKSLELVRPRWGAGGAHLPVHDGCGQPGGEAGDGGPRRPGRRGEVAERGTPAVGGHRGGQRPAGAVSGLLMSGSSPREQPSSPYV